MKKKTKIIVIFLIVIMFCSTISFAIYMSTTIGINKLGFKLTVREAGGVPTDPIYVTNIPKLATGMIPIKYVGGNWVITNSSDTSWYNYNTTDKLWANVMLSDGLYKYDINSGNVVDSGNGNSIVATNGTVAIEEANLGSMFVWIPRYEYKITYYTTSARTTATTNNEFSTYGIIDINFISTSTTLATTDYTIHPAFRNGFITSWENGEWKNEIDGIWFAKFEASNDTGIRYIASPTTENYVKILPNKPGWSGVSVENAFSYCMRMNTTNADDYGISATASTGIVPVDTHLVKNSEWAAVAYLAFSEYGRDTVAPTINNYMSAAPRTTRTGVGSSSTSSSVSTGYGTNIYTSANGLLANTTGNITGIYDMCGGLNEHIATFCTGKSLSTYSGNSEYTTVYTATDIANGKIGDATRETAGWNNDSCVTVTDYFMRGGAASGKAQTGFFSLYNVTGEGGTGGGSPDFRGFRPVLIVE